MAIQVKNNFVKEDIVDEKGNKLGEIKFNPNDSRIMSKLTKIVNDLSKSLKELDKIKKDKDFSKKMEILSKEKLEDIEEFESASEVLEQLNHGYDIELETVTRTIEDLSEVFGKETVEIFTGGTKDIMSVMPLVDYVIPYVKKARNEKVNKYIPKANSDVME